MTKEEALKYMDGWGREKTAENIAHYWDLLEVMTRKYCPELRNAGYNAVGAANVILMNHGEKVGDDR